MYVIELIIVPQNNEVDIKSFPMGVMDSPAVIS